MKEQEDKKFQRAIIISAILHLVLLGVFFLGFPSVFEKLPEEPDVMTFEILSMSDITNIKTENIVAKKAIEPEKSKEVKKSATAKKQAPTPLEAKPEEKKEPVKEEEKPKDAEKIPEKESIKKEEKKTEPEKKVEPKIEPKKDPKKETPKPKAKKKIAPIEEDSLDSILKNLEEESIGTDSKILKKSNAEQVEGTKKARGMEYNEESPLSITEKNYIKNRVEEHWRKPAGLNLEGISIYVHMSLETNGQLKKLPEVISSNCQLAASVCKLVEDTILRAIKEASPFENLTIDRYDIWQENKMRFDPGSMD